MEKIRFTNYVHNGYRVFVIKDVKGKHREHCLCHGCIRFSPDGEIVERELANCPIVNQLFSLCTKYDLVTPLYECKHFLPDPDKSEEDNNKY